MRYLRKSIPILLFITLLLPAYAYGGADNANWKELYTDYINDNPATEPTMSSYSLIYINDDDIPELWISFGLGFEGGALCTVWEGKLEVLRFSQGGFSYLERQNQFAISTGRMDVYHDEIYRIQNGKFARLYKGNFGAKDNSNVQYDAAGDPIYQYFWDNKEVSQKEYESAKESVFDYSKSVSPNDNSCSAIEIIPRIKAY